MQNTNQLIISKLTLVMSVMLTVSGLTACSTGKTIAVVDDSADYKSSQSLQPLKRPSQVKPKEVALVGSEVQVTQAPEATINDEPKSTSETESQALENQDQTNVVINSEIISGENSESRLLIDAGFEQSWAYVNDSLKTSDLTVFSRNKSAGRFLIGCGDIDSEVATVQKSGWSFFNRDKSEKLEYCVLEVTEKRSDSIVKFLNRSGIEVLGEYSMPIFERLLDN